MTAAAWDVTKQALALPERERLKLAGVLLKSVPKEDEAFQEECDKEWKAELEKRVDELRTGKVKAIPASRVMAELRAKYR